MRKYKITFDGLAVEAVLHSDKTVSFTLHDGSRKFKKALTENQLLALFNLFNRITKKAYE